VEEAGASTGEALGGGRGAHRWWGGMRRWAEETGALAGGGAAQGVGGSGASRWGGPGREVGHHGVGWVGRAGTHEVRAREVGRLDVRTGSRAWAWERGSVGPWVQVMNSLIYHL
jgi:hypothetical protein